MIASRSFAGRTVAVFGLARTGLGAVRSLVAGGASVIAWDDNSIARDVGGLAGAEIMPWREWPWENIAALILSPGVPLTHPKPHEVVAHARAATVEVIGDVELFAREIRADGEKPGRAPVIAITGTNGKSTTTALVGHILAQAGFDAQIGGNIGNSVLELAPPGARSIYVLEMSSFQIDLTPGLKPDIALLSNLTPDHIDRHGNMQNYAAIKQRLLSQIPKDGQAIVGVDDAYGAAIFTQLSGKSVTAWPSLGI
jgi:UDP-N-acetylmuramoylalanine--D-glutamate ligase